MPAWLLPAVKLILPHVGQIVAAARPAFTKLKGGSADPQGVVEQQIAELQAAVSDNATHIKELAEQLRLTVSALGDGAAQAERRMKRAYLLAAVSGLLSLAALIVAVYAALR